MLKEALHNAKQMHNVPLSKPLHPRTEKMGHMYKCSHKTQRLHSYISHQVYYDRLLHHHFQGIRVCAGTSWSNEKQMMRHSLELPNSLMMSPHALWIAKYTTNYNSIHTWKFGSRCPHMLVHVLNHAQSCLKTCTKHHPTRTTVKTLVRCSARSGV